jgi:hypothetical protein
MRVGFAFANGALALSIPMFNNKLVFHDIDNTTSLFIHFSPALFFFSLRWGGGRGTSLIEDTWPNLFQVCEGGGACMEKCDAFLWSVKNMMWYTDYCGGNIIDFSLYPALAWLVFWGLPYSILVFGIMPKVHSGFLDDTQTLYKDTIDGEGLMSKVVKKFPECLWPFAYMFTHFIYTMLLSFASCLLWNSFLLNTVFLLALLLICIRNGSTFLFRVTALRHVAEKVDKALEGRGFDSSKQPLLSA